MDFEAAVMEFLAANGNTFVSPQYPIGGTWSCPDFIAIRPASKECFVVEVSAAWDLKNLAEKVRNREKQWFTILREHLFNLGVCDSEWSFQVLVFVRSERIGWFWSVIENANNVHVLPIDITLMPWNWPDEYRSPNFSFSKESAKHRPAGLTLEN
jgi:hypothetical protein